MLDEIYKQDKKKFMEIEKALLSFISINKKSILEKIYKEKALSKDLESELKNAIHEFLNAS